MNKYPCKSIVCVILKLAVFVSYAAALFSREIQRSVQPIVRAVSSLTASDTATSYLSTDRKLSM